MASLSAGYSFGSTEQVTNSKLAALVNNGVVSSIVDADISTGAAITLSKINITAASINYDRLNLGGNVVNADISTSAAIAGSKLADASVDGSKLTGLANIVSGAGVIPSANLPTANWVPNNIQVFTSTGTWPKPDGISNVFVKAWGDGGGGAGGVSGILCGGGSGGYAEGVIAVTGNVTVTIGTGGTGGSGSGSSHAGSSGTGCTFAGTTILTANGGGGGSATPGTGGSASNGSVNITGNSGATGASGGQGANSIYGVGMGGYPNLTVTNNGQGYGSGGNGVGSGNTGGSGAPGLVIVYY